MSSANLLPVFLYNYTATVAAPAAAIITEEAIEAIIMRVTGTDLIYAASLHSFYCRRCYTDALTGSVIMLAPFIRSSDLFNSSSST